MKKISDYMEEGAKVTRPITGIIAVSRSCSNYALVEYACAIGAALVGELGVRPVKDYYEFMKTKKYSASDFNTPIMMDRNECILTLGDIITYLNDELVYPRETTAKYVRLLGY